MDNLQSPGESGLNENLIASIIGSSAVLAQRKISRHIALFTVHAARTKVHYENLDSRKAYMLEDSTSFTSNGFWQRVHIGLKWRWDNQYQKQVNDAQYHKWWGFAFLARGMDTNNPRWFTSSIKAFEIAYEQENKPQRFSHSDLYQLHPYLELARYEKKVNTLQSKIAHIEDKLEEVEKSKVVVKKMLQNIQEGSTSDANSENATALENELNDLCLYEAKAWRILGYIYHRIFDVFGNLDEHQYDEKAKGACKQAVISNSMDLKVVKSIEAQLGLLEHKEPLEADIPFRVDLFWSTLFLLCVLAVVFFGTSQSILWFQIEQWNTAKRIAAIILILLCIVFIRLHILENIKKSFNLWGTIIKGYKSPTVSSRSSLLTESNASASSKNSQNRQSVGESSSSIASADLPSSQAADESSSSTTSADLPSPQAVDEPNEAHITTWTITAISGTKINGKTIPLVAHLQVDCFSGRLTNVSVDASTFYAATIRTLKADIEIDVEKGWQKIDVHKSKPHEDTGSITFAIDNTEGRVFTYRANWTTSQIV